MSAVPADRGGATGEWLTTSNDDEVVMRCGS